MIPKRTVTCTGGKVYHQSNILLAFGKDTIFVKCNDRYCKRWTRVRIHIPGINLNFQKAGITQELLPDGYHLHIAQSTVVVSQYKKEEL